MLLKIVPNFADLNADNIAYYCEELLGT